MKMISTGITILVVITGLTLKMMRLQRITNGEGAVSSFEMGRQAGANYASKSSSPKPSEVQANPFFD